MNPITAEAVVDPRQKVYLSCTTDDLGTLKRDLLSAFADYAPVEAYETSMEASDKGVVQRCLTDVGSCDVYVGLVGFQYGWIPPWEDLNPERLSITELEFREATRLGKARLIFLAELEGWNAAWVDDDPAKKAAVASLRTNIESDKNLSFERFKLEDQRRLPMKILDSLRSTVVHDQNHVAAILGDQPPFPGLYAFCYEDRHFYFGRRNEIELATDLLAREDCQSLIVSGASGTGKSSLVEAGILPRVRPTDTPANNTDWFLRVRPADNLQHPLFSIAYRLTDRLPRKPRPEHLVDAWVRDPAEFARSMTSLTHPTTVIVLDQLEELFTAFSEESLRIQFAACLEAWSRERGPVERSAPAVLASIRSDYKDQLQEIPFLREALENRHYIDLFSLSSAAVYQMISEPAKMVGLDVSEVVEDLVASTASQPASLPLLASTLRTLWEHRSPENSLSLEKLEALGGMHGIISQQADTALERFKALSSDADAEEAFDDLFSLLVQVNLDGAPVRRVAMAADLGTGPAYRLAIEFASEDIRLMYFGGEAEGGGTVEVVHEAIFRSWSPLSNWIGARLKHEHELAQARFFAKDWSTSRDQQVSRLEVTRIHDAHRSMRALGIEPTQLDETTLSYLFPKPALKEQLKRPSYEVSFDDRARIGDLLDRLYREWDGSGDDREGTGVDRHGIPNGSSGYWGEVAPGTIEMEVDPTTFVDQVVHKSFRMAKFPVTQSQFKAFLAAADGYSNPKNWTNLGFTPDPHPFPDVGDNRPVVNVAWIEAVAYCEWLDNTMRHRGLLPEDRVVRLPTEQEWQLASTSETVMQLQLGEQQEWELASGAFGLMAVGLSPVANSDSKDFLDFSNYTWEWCLNQYEDYSATEYDPDVAERAVRGGSFLVSQKRVRERFRGALHMRGRDVNIGFRICIAASDPS